MRFTRGGGGAENAINTVVRIYLGESTRLRRNIPTGSARRLLICTRCTRTSHRNDNSENSIDRAARTTNRRYKCRACCVCLAKYLTTMQNKLHVSSRSRSRPSCHVHGEGGDGGGIPNTGKIRKIVIWYTVVSIRGKNTGNIAK